MLFLKATESRYTLGSESGRHRMAEGGPEALRERERREIVGESEKERERERETDREIFARGSGGMLHVGCAQ